MLHFVGFIYSYFDYDFNLKPILSLLNVLFMSLSISMVSTVSLLSYKFDSIILHYKLKIYFFILLLMKILHSKTLRRNQLIPIWQLSCWVVESQCHQLWQLSLAAVSSTRLSPWVSQLRVLTVKEWSTNILEMHRPCVFSAP